MQRVRYKETLDPPPPHHPSAEHVVCRKKQVFLRTCVMSNCSDKWPSESLTKKTMNLPEQAKSRSLLAQSCGEHSWRRYYLGFHSLVNLTFVLIGQHLPLFSPITTSLWRRVNGMVCAVDFISKGLLFKALYLLLCDYFVVFLDFVLRCRSFTHL